MSQTKKPEAFDKKLAAYALAAGAGLAISAQTASGAIIYTEAHLPINSLAGPGSTPPIDMNGDGQPDFLLYPIACSCVGNPGTSSVFNHFLGLLTPGSNVIGLAGCRCRSLVRGGCGA